MFTFAGQLGYSGMNSCGVAHFANGLYNSPWRLALPHYPLKRVMFEQENLEQCVAVLKAHPACSAGNMVFCSGSGEIADVEIRSDGVSQFFGKNPDVLLHTNHYLTDEFVQHEDNTLRDSCPRLDRIGELIGGQMGEITVDTMKTILADHSGDPAGICRHGDKGMHSVSGYIAEPAKGVLHIRRGHGCLGSWQAYEV
jgi:isopenicillin-N N-acyltransferase-like protein